MKGKLYTLLKVNSDYGLDWMEEVIWRKIQDVTHEEYVHYLIELRDGGFIHEDKDGNPITYRSHYLTEKGRSYLSELKRLYLKELLLRCLKWNLKNWYVALIAVLLGKCCS